MKRPMLVGLFLISLLAAVALTFKWQLFNQVSEEPVAVRNASPEISATPVQSPTPVETPAHIDPPVEVTPLPPDEPAITPPPAATPPQPAPQRTRPRPVAGNPPPVPANEVVPVTEAQARDALNLVGTDAEADKVWYAAINDPNLPARDRKNLIEDLNENGFADPDHVTPNDLPLIEARIAMIEAVGNDAMDDVNYAAFEEAYKDLLDMRAKLVGQ